MILRSHPLRTTRSTACRRRARSAGSRAARRRSWRRCVRADWASRTRAAATTSRTRSTRAGRVRAPEYTILFAGLQLADAERLTQRLDALGVQYRLSGGGDAVMVPADRALKLRMSLAEEGQPVGSTVGYELLDKAGPFGTSE